MGLGATQCLVNFRSKVVSRSARRKRARGVVPAYGREFRHPRHGRFRSSVQPGHACAPCLASCLLCGVGSVAKCDRCRTRRPRGRCLPCLQRRHRRCQRGSSRRTQGRCPSRRRREADADTAAGADIGTMCADHALAGITAKRRFRCADADGHDEGGGSRMDFFGTVFEPDAPKMKTPAHDRPGLIGQGRVTALIIPSLHRTRQPCCRCCHAWRQRHRRLL